MIPGDDPSTAWKTSDGEWRIIGNQGCSPEGGNPLYGSMDFVSWYKIGCTTMMVLDTSALDISRHCIQ